ncbi:hypothetical protein E2C01_024236 [Portunus trituberculatus]|uniref:Uncharacterized protein n=1 Tax=Portunus trituberculatus TaxID=210409 RepID=A0A5B7EE16_PORTR|nr:hypothetical protein [Portunus trituberculatus]
MNALSPSCCHKDFSAVATVRGSETSPSPHLKEPGHHCVEEETYCSDLVRSSCSSLLCHLDGPAAREGGRLSDCARLVEWPPSPRPHCTQMTPIACDEETLLRGRELTSSSLRQTRKRY